MIALTIFGQTPSKKSSQLILHMKKGMKIIPNPLYLRWQSRAIFQLKEQKQKLGLKMIIEPVSVKCLIYRNTKRKVDLSNLIQSVHDVLQKAEIIKDDFLIENLDGSARILGVNAGEERAEIYLEQI